MLYDNLERSRPLTSYEQGIETEVLAGFSKNTDEQERIADCVRILAYYNLEGSRFIHLQDGDFDPKLESTGITRRCIDILTSLAYSPPPSRSILDDEASDKFLQSVLLDNLANQLFQRADVFATLLGISAIEAVPAEGLKPIRAYLWDYSQFVVRSDEDDATAIAHIITRDVSPDGRQRLTWWSKDFRRVYLGTRQGNILTAGGRSFKLDQDTVNPYGRLPFGFFHAAPPVSELTTPGIGSWLADQEASIDEKRYQLSLGFRKYMLPRPWVSGVSANWQPEDIAGEFMRIPSDVMSQDIKQPSIGFLQPQLDTDQADAHIDKAISRVLEAVGVPEAAYRMVQSSALSGDALEAEQKPLVDYTRARQEVLKLCETDTAEAILAVAGAYLNSPALSAAGQGGVNLTVEWPADLVSVPGVDQDTQDKNALEMGLESLVDVTRRRFRLNSAEEALRKLLRVQEDNRKLQMLGILPGSEVTNVQAQAQE